NGTVMLEVKIAYETYGWLAPDGRNAVLIAHGYTSSHHAAGRNPANGNLPGWWDGLIGHGKAIDTDKLFVVSSNMLGSSFGSTNGASVNPGTGRPYGGYQAFQWAVTYPDFMDGIVAVVTAPKSQNAEKSLAELEARLATDPEWNGGWYYDRGGAKIVVTK